MPQQPDPKVDQVLRIDPDREIGRISKRIVELLRTDLRRRGLVVAISGGIDSSLACALAVEAVGKGRVFGLLMPETDSSPVSLERGRLLARHLGIEHHIEDISPILEAIGCYRWRDEAIRRVFPEYGKGWKSKIAIGGGVEKGINYFNLIVQTPGGETRKRRLGHREYLQIVAATNFKQRIRKTLEYFHADRLNYAVAGTPNRVEYDQGFFVKNGDGSADLKPIAHLYKSQVFVLARHMGLPEDIVASEPTTDTYSLPQGQDEFYFTLPYREMDLALWHRNRDLPPSDLAEALGISEGEARSIYDDIDRKRLTTGPLHWPGIPVVEIDGPVSSPPKASDAGHE
jgi:NAD+ synthase